MSRHDPEAEYDRLLAGWSEAMTRRQTLGLILAAVVEAVSACGPSKPPSKPSPSPTASPSPAPASPTTSPAADVLARWCPDDPVTSTSFDTARAAIANGADDVALSPGGCVRIRSASHNGQLQQQTLVVQDKTIGGWSGTGDHRELTWDLDGDGFAERVRAVESGTSVLTTFDPSTRQPRVRTTLTMEDDADSVVVETVGSDGGWVESDRYSTPADTGWEQRAGDVRAPALADGACSPAQAEHLQGRLQNAYRTGMNCLDNYGASDLGFELAFQLATRDVVFSCAYATPCAAHLDRQSYYDQSQPIRISVDWPCFTSTLSDYEQAKVIFHELLHAQLGPHDSRNRDYARFGDLDRVTSCENLCFGPEDLTACTCATCLQTSTCDDRCKKLPQCDAQLGFRCPCKSGRNAGKLFASCSACLATCPSGLGCFGISTCDVEYRGCETPPTCP